MAIQLWQDDLETYITLPSRKEVCPRCEGNGSHVNPNVDGFTRENLDEWFGSDADEFLEDYFSGRYDVPCERCGGANVIDVIDEERCPPELLRQYEKQQEEEWEYEQMVRMEREMGC